MVITRDYRRLQILNTRITTNLVHNQQRIDDENNTTTTLVNLTKHIYAIPKNL
jgi:hypothetical protein